MSFLANKLDLSQSLIDTRHSATHAALPSLNTLINEMNTAFNWLRNHYWEQQSAKHKDGILRLRNSLLEYRLQTSNHLRKGTVRKLEQGESIRRVMKQCESMNMIQDSVVPLLLNEGFIFPSDEQIQSSVMKNWLLEHYNENGITVSNENNSLPLEAILPPPSPLLTIWKPVIDSFSQTWPHFYYVLLQSIIRSLSDFTHSSNTKSSSVNIPLPSGDTLLPVLEVRNLILCSWIIVLIDEYSPLYNDESKKEKKKKVPKQKSKNSVSLKKYHDMIQPDFNVLWRQCMLIHSKWGRVLSSIFQSRTTDLTKEKRTNIPVLLDLNKDIESITSFHYNIQKSFFETSKTDTDVEMNDNENNILEKLEELLNVSYIFV